MIAYDKVIVKLDIAIPYGGGMHSSTLLSIPVTKHTSDITMLTVNRSPHGNKTAREQFKMVGHKYNTKVLLGNISNAYSVFSYFGDIGVVQGMNNINVGTSMSYKTSYCIRII